MPATQIERRTIQDWTWSNPTLGPGVVGVVVENNAFKVGNGRTSWKDLPYGNVGDILGLTGVWDSIYKRELRENKAQDLADPSKDTYPSTQAVWEALGSVSGTAWGGISGTITNQTDLISQIDGAKNRANHTGNADYNDATITGYKAVINSQSGTSYTLQASDTGKIIVCNNPAPITITIDSVVITAGFNCTIVQKGAGAVGFALSGAGTILPGAAVTTQGAGFGASIICDIDESFLIVGGVA